MKAKLRTFATTLIVAPPKGVHSRQMPGVVVIDGARRIRLANHASVAMLRPLAGGELELSSGGELPTTLQALLDEIEDRLAIGQDTCTVMVPSCDICVRACSVGGSYEASVMLLIERASREDVVRSALASYPLTPREAEVAGLVLRGYSNRRIADHLVLAEYTVEDHLKRIFAKVGVRSRSALSSKILGIRDKEEAAG
ncbi:MAG TPA: LuxR C-terminal-related transcriptional regulator [Candidatus Acidoferrales bacterium]|nr:LuxR C-terminal-related transcriptional regulator [Candidatus Acidoferrales bacterium]